MKSITLKVGAIIAGAFQWEYLNYKDSNRRFVPWKPELRLYDFVNRQMYEEWKK